MLEKLTHWNPLRSVREHSKPRGTGIKEPGQLREAMNRVFDGFLRDRYTESEEAIWWPAVDVSETDTALVVRAELPGMTKKEVDISLQDNVLTLQGEKTRKKKTKHEEFSLVERSFGRFYQAFTLPVAIDPENVTAAFTQGVLTITLPKTESTTPQRIPISTS
jgi:HSP20 family protein